MKKTELLPKRILYDRVVCAQTGDPLPRETRGWPNLKAAAIVPKS